MLQGTFLPCQCTSADLPDEKRSNLALECGVPGQAGIYCCYILSSVLRQFPLSKATVCVDVNFNLPFLVSTTAPSSAERPWCTTLTCHRIQRGRSVVFKVGQLLDYLLELRLQGTSSLIRLSRLAACRHTSCFSSRPADTFWLTVLFGVFGVQNIVR
jgi:hypothetical protein